MSGTPLKVNLPVGSGWKSTLTLAFAKLNKISFIVEDTFSFGDFDPSTNFNSMVVTNYALRRARYLKIYKFLFFSVDIAATLATPFANSVAFTIPGTAAGASPSLLGSSDTQGAACFADNAGTGEAALWQIVAGTSSVRVFRSGIAAYTAGSFRVKINGFVEVI